MSALITLDTEGADMFPAGVADFSNWRHSGTLLAPAQQYAGTSRRWLRDRPLELPRGLSLPVRRSGRKSFLGYVVNNKTLPGGFLVNADSKGLYV